LPLGALIWRNLPISPPQSAKLPITKTATRKLYQHPENYDKTARDLKKQIHPS
jgi:hypothetical protein